MISFKYAMINRFKYCRNVSLIIFDTLLKHSYNLYRIQKAIFYFFFVFILI